MSDDPLELPLFDPPPQEPVDAPIIIEPLDLTAAATQAELLPNAPPERPPTAQSEPPSPEPSPPARQAEPQPAGIGGRFTAGLIDLLLHAVIGALLVGGSALLGVEIAARHAAPLAVVLLLFSFLYHVVPLAFWGNTPGMAVVDLRTRTLDDLPLSLPQATGHWLALLLTVLSCGTGVLLALGGKSLADRLSSSQTLQS